MLSFFSTVKADSSQALPDDIKGILSDYSQFVATGNTSREDYYSTAIKELAKERHAYYQEFFTKGLHSNLVSMESQFLIERGVTITQTEKTSHISIAESVILYGIPITILPDEYPLIQAAKWASDQTMDRDLKYHLQEYIDSMTRDVRTSIDNGFQVVFVVNHEIVIERMNEQTYIVKDSFSDAAKDNAGGFDEIKWIDKVFIRSKPIWLQFPDYVMYHTPIDEIGRSLLVEFQAVSQAVNQEGSLQSIDYNYDRVAARNYIVQYTSNPDYYDWCNWDPHVVLDESKWNPAYEEIWEDELLFCNDCADYVSQALVAGGLPTDDEWWPALVFPWVNVLYQKQYLEQTSKGIMVDSYWALQIGDLGFKESNGLWQHVVMLSYVNPHLYSAHTNDRQNYTFSSVAFNKYMHISNNTPSRVLLPLIINSGNVLYEHNQPLITSVPYPSPRESLPTAISPYP